MTSNDTTTASAGRDADTELALRMTNVRKTYQLGDEEVVALDHVDLSVARGEILCLLGPSGSGKTTLCSIAGGLLSATEGEVVVGGEDITDFNSKQLSKFRSQSVGFVFQAVNLVPFLNARENLLYVSTLQKRISRKDAQRRADELLGELGIADRAKNLPEQLSGGERQRVAIGRALMNDPDLILVDEPTAALDTKLGRQVVELLAREVKQRGKTGIMVTHDLRMVEYTDRVFEILDGVLTHVEQPSALQH